MTHIAQKTIGTAALALVLSISALPVLASEVTGDVSSGGGSTGGTQGSYTDGGLVADVSSPSSGSGAAADTSSSGSSQTSSRSLGAHRHSAAAEPSTPSSGVQSDGSLAQANDYTGTGGGYDPTLESYLASINKQAASADVALSANDAVAYNAAIGNVPETSNVAAAAESDSARTGKIWTTVILGLSLLGLSAYAANVFLSFRRGL